MILGPFFVFYVIKNHKYTYIYIKKKEKLIIKLTRTAYANVASRILNLDQ